MHSYKILLTATCLLPVLAYPFLPSVSRSGIRCEALFVWYGVVLGVLSFANGFLFRWELELWQITLVEIYAMAGYAVLLLPSSSEVKVDDLDLTARMLATEVVWYQTGVFQDTLLARKSGWMARASLQLFGGFFVGYLIFLATRDYLSGALFHFFTRRVSWWHWLPENGSDDEFGPGWSMFLVVAVVIAPLALFSGAIAGLQ
ncbi:hypothetical protein V2A60_010067 [Cordyceps javanica]